jgi:hypothetical protein
MTPVSVAKMKSADPPVGSTKFVGSLTALWKTIPVGALSTDTTSDGIVFVAALYSVEVSDPLFAIHHGVGKLCGPETRPQAFTTFESCCAGAPATSETSGCTV